MLFQADDFEVEFEGMIISVKVKPIEGETVFQLLFPDNRPPLIVYRAKALNGSKVWMSIPQGRQSEAIPLGAKIVQHFQNQNKGK